MTLQPKIGDIIEIEQGNFCFEVRVMGITKDGYLCEQDNVRGAVLLESVKLDEADVTDIEDFLKQGGEITALPYKNQRRERSAAKRLGSAHIGKVGFGKPTKGGVTGNRANISGKTVITAGLNPDFHDGQTQLTSRIHKRLHNVDSSATQRKIHRLREQILEFSQAVHDMKKSSHGIDEAGIDPTLGPRGRDRDMRNIDPGPEQRYYFQVPFKLKNLAKDMELKWDSDKKKWFTTSILTKIKAERKFEPWKGVAEADKHYSNTKNPVDFPKTWHDVDKKLGRAVDKMSQAEKVKKGLAHPDTLKKKGVAEGSLKEVSLDLAKRARDKAEHMVDMDYDDMRDKPYGHSEKQRIKFQKYIDKKEPRAKGDRDWSPPKQGVAEGSLNELDTATLKSYRKKAGDEVNAIKQKQELGQLSNDDFFKKQDRLRGIGQATRRIVKRDITDVAEGSLNELFEPQTEYYELSNGDIIQAWYRPLPNQTAVPGTVKIRHVDPALMPKGSSFNSTGTVHRWDQAPDGVKQAIEKYVRQANGVSRVAEAEYQGRQVPLGKPMAGDVAKSKVYVRKPNGKVVKVNFGDKNMTIKRSNPARRKSFRARHNCDNPGPRWRARYWSCRAW